MKSYEEYLRSHDGWHEMVARLHRDILAELEKLDMRCDMISITFGQEIERLDARLAKLEERLAPKKYYPPLFRLDDEFPETLLDEEEARKP